MTRSALDIANELLDAAERARQAGDTVASITLALKAAEYTQLAKLLGDEITKAEATPARSAAGRPAGEG
ncbi:hypothetical protein FDP22_07445 [Paroceanicella profunda]|uniref:Uncharacterized protein n=1 Tax=Paroceanicella profunda TaxID=2579971 RepID=A0A5B8FW30_9RHOB|nr:hypothetical protein [Paroceanicella profunda]QDL91634.1 hypothetical protein FDP22_07445 [Paroceanicella profunda]